MTLAAKALINALAGAVLTGCATPEWGEAGSPSSRFRAAVELPTASSPGTLNAVQPAPRVADRPPAPTNEAVPPSSSARVPGRPGPEAAPDPRFDLIVSGGKVRDVFLAMVNDTPYSMVMHPDVAGELSVSLRSVTLREALNALRDVYGYEYQVEGRRILVFPPRMQTRLFTVNYLHTRRQGHSEVRVSGSGAPAATGAMGATGLGAGPVAGSGAPAGAGMPDSSQITTSSTSDIWAETVTALRALVGNAGGRAVIASPQAGTIAVRAMPEELRQVDAFLRASRVAVERQVMLEAKIVEVELRAGFSSGIDWSYLGQRGAIGQTSGYATNPLLSNGAGLPTLAAAALGVVDSVALPAGNGGALGLALATKGFQAVMGFLQTQGDLQVLSSPRIATLNNQKAVLKVGTDEYFVTNVAGGSVPSGTGINNGTTTLPTLTLTPFFSGIALDVTPQIDENDIITLHLRPSVTSVTEKTKQIDLGSVGNYRLPLASSSVNETDTVVRVPDGNIVAIGGLMQSQSSRSQSGLPGSDSNMVTRTLFGNQADNGRKKEVVVLIRPTIIRGVDDWARSAEGLLVDTERTPRRVIRVGSESPTAAPAATAK